MLWACPGLHLHGSGTMWSVSPFLALGVRHLSRSVEKYDAPAGQESLSVSRTSGFRATCGALKEIFILPAIFGSALMFAQAVCMWFVDPEKQFDQFRFFS